jgi:D-beta-D-heptose 7-phosphate kinase / D-beta-D-heptose 1-phosphate adenosyltransferase
MIDFTKFEARKVLCVGDLLVHEIVYGRPRSTASTPSIVAQRSELSLDGVAGVAKAVAALGSRCSIVAPVGDDQGASSVRHQLGALEMISLGLMKDPKRSTVRTTCYLAELVPAPMFTVEQGDIEPVRGQVEEGLLARILGEVLEADVVVLSDHSCGALTDRLTRDTIAAARQQGIPTLVASSCADFSRYAGATILAPGFAHFCASTARVPASTDELESVALQVLERTSIEALLVVQPEHGMSFIPRATSATHLGISGMSGAEHRCNDAGIAALALALACGCPWEEAMEVCHAAAAVRASEPEGLSREGLNAGTGAATPIAD